MGHRALIAYERPDGQYNLHYSHWGACDLRLKRRLTPETPFGGDEPVPARRELFDALLAGEYDDHDELKPIDLADPADADEPNPAVDVGPLATAITRETAITEHLDFHHHEAFYVVGRDVDVTAYRTYWFGLQFDTTETTVDHPTRGFGALKTTRWHEGEPVGDAHDYGRWRALKDVTGDVLDRGIFDEDEALGYLKAKLIRWAQRREDLLLCDSDGPGV